MDGMDGIQAMHTLLKRNNVWKIVFVTNYEGRMIETFGLKTLGFVKKSSDMSEVRKWLSIAVEELKKVKTIEVMNGNRKTQIRTEDIYYIQSDVNNVSIFTRNEIFYALGNIKQWEKLLGEFDFIRIHKSYIVNLEYTELINSEVYLRDINKALPIGRTYKKELKEKARLYILEKVRNRTDV